MSRVDLPRPLASYFAGAELTPNRQGRRFTLTFPYFDGDRLDRLQWWWQVSPAQERIGGEAGLEALRQDAIERFAQHISRWLESAGRRLYDGAPFPRLAAGEEAVPVAEAVGDAQIPVVWPVGTLPEGKFQR